MKLISTFAFLIALCLAAPVSAATQVDINSADAKTLAQSLQGVGLVKAEAIVAYRNAHGPFASLDDLAKVDGIGPRIIEENRGAIVFGKPRSAEAAHATSPRPQANGNW
jgi:competence protein ComEA